MWPVQRLILEGKASLAEIDTYYSINDVADQNEALDAWHEAQRSAEQ